MFLKYDKEKSLLAFNQMASIIPVTGDKVWWPNDNNFSTRYEHNLIDVINEVRQLDSGAISSK